jgi:hypothetical protein
VDRGPPLDGFDFHDDSVVNQKVSPASFLEHHPFVLESNGLWSRDLKSAFV